MIPTNNSVAVRMTNTGRVGARRGPVRLSHPEPGWVSLVDVDGVEDSSWIPPSMYRVTEFSQRIEVRIYRADDWPGFVVAPLRGIHPEATWSFCLKPEVTFTPEYMAVWEQWDRGGSAMFIGRIGPDFPIFAGDPRYGF